jgi:hypothetical protein
MKALLDAFLELPTWQEILLIAIPVFAVACLCIWAARAGYRTGMLRAISMVDAALEKSRRKERSI